MTKKLLAIAVVTLISINLMACNNGNTEIFPDTTTSKSKTVTEDKYSKIVGVWAKDIPLNELKENYNSLLAEVEAKTKEFGLEYKEEEIVKEENNETVNNNYIYLDQKNPEKNRLESLYFGLSLYGSDLAMGQITMKLSLNFDGDKALKSGEVKVEDTSIADYSELFTKNSKRDYSDINKKILDVLKSENSEGVIENNVDGLYEEFTVSKEYIVYKIETKKIDFAKATEEVK